MEKTDSEGREYFQIGKWKIFKMGSIKTLDDAIERAEELSNINALFSVDRKYVDQSLPSGYYY